jgi:hypothetical protein
MLYLPAFRVSLSFINILAGSSYNLQTQYMHTDLCTTEANEGHLHNFKFPANCKK